LDRFASQKLREGLGHVITLLKGNLPQRRQRLAVPSHAQRTDAQNEYAFDSLSAETIVHRHAAGLFQGYSAGRQKRGWCDAGAPYNRPSADRRPLFKNDCVMANLRYTIIKHERNSQILQLPGRRPDDLRRPTRQDLWSRLNDADFRMIVVNFGISFKQN